MARMILPRGSMMHQRRILPSKLSPERMKHIIFFSSLSEALAGQNTSNLQHSNNDKNLFQNDIKDSYFVQKRSMCTRARHRIVQPGIVGPERMVPSHIPRPAYLSDNWNPVQNGIIIKTDRQIAGIWEACQLAARILEQTSKELRVGITTDEIDELVHKACISQGAYPSPLGYKNFPKSVCTSVNNVACHGIPDNCPLEDGDIINIDVTVYYKGYHGDVNKTYPIGSVDEEGLHLIKLSEHACVSGILACGPGVKFAEIGKAIDQDIRAAGLNVFPLFCGHGIGEDFHEPPDVYHFANEGSLVMKEGMVFTIEPIISEGGNEVKFLEDGWTAVTADDSRTAAWEHTVLITKDGADVLTL